MKNYLQDGDTLTIAAPAAVASGDPVQIGSIFGVAMADAATGADVAIVREGIFTLPKVSAQAWAVGAKIYWDATNKVCTTAAPGNTLIGTATAAAANPSATGAVLLDGTVR